MIFKKLNFCIFDKSFKMTTKENILNKLKLNKLQFSKLRIRNIGLFGSYIRNEQSSESDIDLLIDFEPEKKILIIIWQLTICLKKSSKTKKLNWLLKMV